MRGVLLRTLERVDGYGVDTFHVCDWKFDFHHFSATEPIGDLPHVFVAHVVIERVDYPFGETSGAGLIQGLAEHLVIRVRLIHDDHSGMSAYLDVFAHHTPFFVGSPCVAYC